MFEGEGDCLNSVGVTLSSRQARGVDGDGDNTQDEAIVAKMEV